MPYWEEDEDRYREPTTEETIRKVFMEELHEILCILSRNTKGPLERRLKDAVEWRMRATNQDIPGVSSEWITVMGQTYCVTLEWDKGETEWAAYTPDGILWARGFTRSQDPLEVAKRKLREMIKRDEQ